MKTWRLISALALLLPLAALAAGDGHLRRYARSEIHMGVEFEVVLYAAEAAKADEVLAKAMARIAQLDKGLSDYDVDSELSKLSETSALSNTPAPADFPAVKVSDDLWNVLWQSQQISGASDGAFDITV